MAGGLFNRLHVWKFEEVLKSSDLNAEFDNIINNLSPSFLAGFSTTIAQSQIQLDPGSLGNQNLAANLAEEIQQLRFEISRIIGKTFAFDTPSLSIEAINSLLKLGVGIPTNRIVSGKKDANDQPQFLLADGTTNKITLKATPPFVYVINNNTYSVSTDIVVTSLSVASAVNNTATVNDANIVNDLYAGEENAVIPQITISGAGSEITSRVGQMAAFKFTDGGTEYFIGKIKDSNTITDCFRGYFFDSTGALFPRATLNNGDTLTIMRLTWVFIMANMTAMDFSYTQPVVSIVAPATPAVGDYWFDMTAQIWKKYNGTAFVDATAALIGTCFQDTTACLGTRSGDFFALFGNLNTIRPAVMSSTQIAANSNISRVNIYGNIIDYSPYAVQWNIPTDFDSGVSLTASTTYYLYLTDLGRPKISTVVPFFRMPDLQGLYHPAKPWRSVGTFQTDGGSLAIGATSSKEWITSYATLEDDNGNGAVNTQVMRFLSVLNQGEALAITQDANAGDSILIKRSGLYSLSLRLSGAAAGYVFVVSIGSITIGTPFGQTQPIYCNTVAGGDVTNGATVVPLQAGDILRALSSNAGVANRSFRITLVKEVE